MNLKYHLTYVVLRLVFSLVFSHEYEINFMMQLGFFSGEQHEPFQSKISSSSNIGSHRNASENWKFMFFDSVRYVHTHLLMFSSHQFLLLLLLLYFPQVLRPFDVRLVGRGRVERDPTGVAVHRPVHLSLRPHVFRVLPGLVSPLIAHCTSMIIN